MCRCFFLIYLILTINFSILNCSQTVNLEDTTICLDSDSCEKVDSIYIPSKPDKCSNDLFFHYGEDSSAYLTPDGKINAVSNESECSIGFNRVIYSLKNFLIEVIKHKNSVYVKNVSKKSEPILIEASFSEFIHKKIHDYVQYILIFGIVLINAIIYSFKDCIKLPLTK
jgi:hypothetical protein